VAGPSDREPRAPDQRGLSSLAAGYRKAAPYMGASTTLVAAVGGFAAFGWWIDQKLDHETPWVMVIGAILGMIGGFISFFRTVLGTGKKKS